MRVFPVVLLACALCGIAQGSGALFAEGKRFIFPDREGNVYDVDLTSGKTVQFRAGELGLPADFDPQAASKSGFLLGIAGNKAIACDLTKRTTTTLHTAPGDLYGLSYNPKHGGVLLDFHVPEEEKEQTSCSHPLIYVPADPAEAGCVFCRRVSSVEGMAFATDGTLYFGSRGDVWMGSIDTMESSPEGPKFVLNGSRVAPVATHETDIGTPSGIGVYELAVAGSKLYIGMLRMGGSGWGNMVVIDLPKPADLEEEKAGSVTYARLCSKLMGSLKVLNDNDRPSSLSSSPDGKFVAYLEGMTIVLVNAKTGTERRIEVKP